MEPFNFKVSYTIVDEAEMVMEIPSDPFLEAGIDIPSELPYQTPDIKGFRKKIKAVFKDTPNGPDFGDNIVIVSNFVDDISSNQDTSSTALIHDIQNENKETFFVLESEKVFSENTEARRRIFVLGEVASLRTFGCPRLL